MRRRPAYAWLVAAVLVGLTAWPLTWPLSADGYPLSTYPMFAVGRHDRVLGLTQALWRGEGGATAPVGPAAVGVGNELQSMQTVSTALARGHGDSLCREIAARVAAWAARYPGAVEIQLAESRFDVLGYFAGDAAPRSRAVRVRCEVER